MDIALKLMVYILPGRWLPTSATAVTRVLSEGRCVAGLPQ